MSVRSIFFPLVCAVLLNCNCFIFSSYQSAKMLRNDEMAVIPSGGVADNTDFSDYNIIQVPAGCSFGVGVNRFLNIYATEGMYLYLDEATDADVNLGNYGTFEVKVSLRRDVTALSPFITYNYIFGEETSMYQTGLRLIQTFYFSSGADLTITPQAGYYDGTGGDGFYLGSLVGIGIPAGENSVIRPELGVVNMDFSDDWYFSLGVGVFIPFKSFLPVLNK